MDKKTLEELYLQQKKTISEIAILSKKGKSTIRTLLLKNKIPIRSKSEFRKLESFKIKNSHCGFQKGHNVGNRFQKGNISQYKSGYSLYRNLLDLISEPFCVVCGSKERLVVHHLDLDRNNGKLENLQIMCNSCHRKWHRYLKDKLGLLTIYESKKVELNAKKIK